MGRRSFAGLVLGATFGALSAIGCSVTTADLPRPGTCDPFELTAVDPAPDSQGIAPDVVPALTFNDFPDPDTIDVSTVLLFTGFYYHTGRYWVDLVDRRAFFRPSGQLGMGLGYTLSLRPGIRSLRGCQLDGTSTVPGSPGGSNQSPTFRFQIVAPGARRNPSPLTLPATSFGQLMGILSSHCAGGACHLGTGDALPPDGLCASSPAGGLSLCARDARDAMVGVPSRQVSRLVLVVPHDSARSYLLRKIIGAPPVVGHVGVPDDTLSQDDQRAIADWIDTGAPGAPESAEANDGGI